MWDSRLEFFDGSQGSGVQLNMKLGETGEPFKVVAKLLVGADGLRSRVREQLTRELGHSTVLRRLGVSVILGIAKLNT